ncbi:MAG TPA: SDR family oxidoreductase [Kofleriaceae bacterium]
MKTHAGSVVVVTGATSGIGEAAVVAFAAAGANVFGIARRQEALQASRARHPAVHWLQADVTNPTEVSKALSAIIAEAGKLDVLVNNAAVFEFAPLEGSSDEMIRSQFEINVIGLATTTRAALPALKATRGTIINISSAAGHKPVPGGSIYGATKAAVESFTKSWALELAPAGIRVNAVAPGPTETPGFDKLPIPKEMVPVVKAQFTSQVPLGRMASADEVARWIVAIAEPNVTWMTGHVLAIDGGMSLT